MVDHYELKPDDDTLALTLSQKALMAARMMQTRKAGTISVPNGDGTSTVIGPGAGDKTIDPFHGDTTAPGRPTGITAVSKGDAVVIVTWPGTLEGGIPADFQRVELYCQRDGDPLMDLGALSSSGSVTSGVLWANSDYEAWAIAFDVQGNKSPESDHVKFHVDDPFDEWQQKMDAADKKAQQAVDGMEQVRKDAEQGVKDAKDAASAADAKAQQAVDGMQSVREDAAKGVKEAKDQATAAQTAAGNAASKADKLSDELDGTKAIVEQHTTKLGEVETKVSNSLEHADQALSAATQAVQTATEIKTTADRAYSDAQSALTQSSTAVQTAGEIKTTLQTNYYSKTDSDAAYASKSELKQTSDGITSTVEKTYATKSMLEALQNVADNAVETWTGSATPTASNAPASTWTTDALKRQHAGDIYYDTSNGYSYRWGSSDGKTYAWTLIKDSDITKAIADAAKAQSTASGAQKGVDKLNADIPITYATKSEVTQTAESITAKVSEAQRVGQSALDKASTVEQTASSLQTTISEQAQTIKGQTTTIGQLTAKADSLSSTLTQTNQKIDGMAIGGTNLLRDTKAFGRKNVSESETGYLRNSSSTTGEEYRGFTSRKLASSSSTGAVMGEWLVNDCQPGDEYVFSFYAKGTGKLNAFFYGPTGYINCWGGSTSTGEPIGGGDGLVGLTLTASWTRYWIRWKLNPNATVTTNVKYVLLRNDSKADWQACAAKLEKGNKATDWSPSPFDSQATADAAITRVSSLEQTLDGFKTTVSQTYETKSDSLAKKTALEQTLNGFKTTVSNTYLSKTDASKTYATQSSLTQTNESLTAKITSAATTASNALSKATSVEATANGLKTTVNEQASTIKGHTSTISQLEQKADSLTSSISQANSKADMALLSGTEWVVDGGVENRSLWPLVKTPWYFEATGVKHSGALALACGFTNLNNDNRYLPVVRNQAGGFLNIPVKPGQRFRFSAWVYKTSDFDGTGDNTKLRIDNQSGQHLASYGVTPTATNTWEFKQFDYVVPANVPSLQAMVGRDGTKGVIVYDEISFRDITDAYNAQSTADTAISRASTLEQTLNSFKTTVSQTYETKSDSLAKKTALEQTLNSFKTTVSSTYSTKSELNTVKNDVKPKVWHHTKGTNGAAGYFYVCSLDIKTNYSNSAIRLTVTNRLSQQTDIEIQFWSTNNTDPGLASLKKSGPANVWMAKGGASHWVLIVQKSGGYDELSVTDLYQGDYNKVAITWRSDQASSLPSGAIAATKLIGSEPAATYTTQSEFVQKTDSITATVSKKLDTATAASTYARASEVKQTTDSLSARITTAQSTADAKVAKGSSGISSLETAMTFDSTGLSIAKKVNGTVQGYQTKLTGQAMEIKNGSGKTVASYGAERITLGQNSTGTIIQMCGGRLNLTTDDDKGFSLDYTNGNGVARMVAGTGGTRFAGLYGDSYDNGSGGLAIRWKGGANLYGVVNGGMNIAGHDMLLNGSPGDKAGTFYGMHRILSGYVTASFAANGAMTTQTVSGLPFSSWNSYTVIVSLANNQGNQVPGFDKCSVIASDFTASSFAIRGWNTDTTTHSYRVAWIAIGI